MNKGIKPLYLAALLALATLGLSGCTTGMAALECGAESLKPTVMAAIDSFESAAISIKMSNKVLQDMPISEQDTWPTKLQGAPSGGAGLKMGLSLAGSAMGVTIPLEIDKETGFPRPTSALYLFLKERDAMLDKEVNKKAVNYFKGKPQNVISDSDKPIGKCVPSETVTDCNVYRNTLMAYGVVTANNKAIQELQNDIDATAKGFKQCNAFIHKVNEEIKDERVKKAQCPDPALKDEVAKQKLASKVSEKQADKEQMEKAHGRLANKVYKAAVSGADFSAAAVVKIGCAVINGARALPNINNEFKNLKGAYNIAMLLPRIKNVISALGIYKDNLSVQWTVYKTMYQQIKGTYEIKDDEPTKEALNRIQVAEAAIAELEPKLALALAGKDVEFSDAEAMKMNVVAAMFPQQLADDAIRTALNAE